MSISKFITTDTSSVWGDRLHNTGSRDQQVVEFIMNQLEWFSTARQEREAIWLETWAAYLGSPAAVATMRNRLLRHVGDVNNDWRHKINVGKAFENVETIISYLQGAFFPNNEWFDVIPTEPGLFELAPVIKKYTATKLQQAAFISHWEMFLRQMCITGTSVLALPWRYETTQFKKKVKVRNPKYGENPELGERIKYKVDTVEKVIVNRPSFETLDIFDVYLQPNAVDVNDSPIIRRLTKTKAELAQCIQSGYYRNLSALDVVQHKPYYSTNTNSVANSNKQLIKTFQGINVENGYHWGDEIELFEYWGDVHLDGVTYYDICATICCNKLVKFETNPYWCGKPFIIGTYIPVVRSISALGTIEPSLGMLHELNIITNQRLDNLELSVNSMWEHVNDGTLQPEDVFTEPGKVFPVAAPGNIRPIEMPRNFTITYDEANVLETRIDKNTGTGAMVGAGVGRSGERVTATEIQATRDAGGNRLSGVHKHIEESALFPLLTKVYRLFQQFIEEDETIRVPGEEIGTHNYIAVGSDELQHEFTLLPVGANHVADKEYEINKTLQFLQVAAQYPEMTKHVNFYAILLKLARLYGFDDVDQYIIEDRNQPEQTQPQQMAPATPNPEEEMMKAFYEGGGSANVSAMQGEMQADGGASMMNSMFGVDIGGAPPAMSPDALAVQ